MIRGWVICMLAPLLLGFAAGLRSQHSVSLYPARMLQGGPASSQPVPNPPHSTTTTYITATENSTLLDVITAALSVESNDDVVATLLGGTYLVTDTMTLNRSLTLQGSHDISDPTVLDCSSEPSISVFITKAMNITLWNLTFSGCTETAVVLSMPVVVAGVAQLQPSVSIEGCSFLNNTGTVAGEDV